MPTIAPEYQFKSLIPWRTRLDGKGEFAETLSSAEQAISIGLGHDGMHYFGDNRKGMLAINFEYGTTQHAISKAEPTSLEEVRISQHLHASVWCTSRTAPRAGRSSATSATAAFT